MIKENRLDFWHIHCMNCGEKICKYKKDVKNINEEKECSFCKNKIRIVIGCEFDLARLGNFINSKGQIILINNFFGFLE